MSKMQEGGRTKEALSVNEFCARYGVGLTTAYKEIREKRLSIRKVGRRTLIPVTEAERWFAAPVAA
jgi:excisionase family DNA binding protein